MVNRVLFVTGSALFGIAACASHPADPAPGAVTTSSVNGDNNFRFYTANANGGYRTAFESLADVYLDASGTLNAIAGEYSFSVVEGLCSPDGSYLQDYAPRLSPIDCRTFTLSPDGQITARAGDASCPNAVNVDATADNAGGLTIQIMPPFDVNSEICRDASGNGVFLAYVYSATNTDVANMFFTAPVMNGDGSGSGSDGGGSGSGSGSDGGGSGSGSGSGSDGGSGSGSGSGSGCGH